MLGKGDFERVEGGSTRRPSGPFVTDLLRCDMIYPLLSFRRSSYAQRACLLVEGGGFSLPTSFPARGERGVVVVVEISLPYACVLAAWVPFHQVFSSYPNAHWVSRFLLTPFLFLGAVFLGAFTQRFPTNSYLCNVLLQTSPTSALASPLV